MCTVTYIPVHKGYLLTSSRDEKAIREPAFPPAAYLQQGKKMFYPKDAKAGGTWIVYNADTGNTLVLLNGAFKKHEQVLPYRKSRGLVLLDIAAAVDPVESFTNAELHGIEPFTVIMLTPSSLFECRWDGSTKHICELDVFTPYIWSSVTLYTDEVVAARKKWFDEWLTETDSPDLSAVTAFHLTAGNGDQCNDIRMNRNDELFTVSITCVSCFDTTVQMHYHDLQAGNISEHHCNGNQINSADKIC